MDTLLRLFHQHILSILVLLFCIGLGSAFWFTQYYSNERIYAQAVYSAKQYAKTLMEARILYSDKVASPLQGTIEVSHDYHEKNMAIPNPATYLIELGVNLKKKEPETTFRLYSDHPFPNRRKVIKDMDGFEYDALNFLRQFPNSTYVKIEEHEGRRSLRYAQADIMNQQCVDCHNIHPDSPKRDWQAGDVRGVLEITQPLDVFFNQARNSLTSTFILFGLLSVLALIGLGIVLYELRHNAAVLLAKNRTFERFVPTEFLTRLGKAELEEVHLGDTSTETMAVLFADIRSFTTMSEQMSAQDNLGFLNEYLQNIAPCIHEHHGFIDKYIGDAIMALFPGCDGSDKSIADDAVRAGLAMQSALSEFNQQRLKSGQPVIQIGTGIHLGNLILGTIGFEGRMESTVIGDTVNLASRVESLTKYYGIQLAITEEVANTLSQPENCLIREIDKVRVPGKTEATTIYEVMDGYPETFQQKMQEYLPLYNIALSKYREHKWAEAHCLFEKLQCILEADKVSQIYMQRCESFRHSPPAPDWDVWVMIYDAESLLKQVNCPLH
ncbi:MAG: adenylate/guanylate cyclase domain-containing protein [Pseudomonadota bacterium]